MSHMNDMICMKHLNKFNEFQREVEIIVIRISRSYNWIIVEIFELQVLANI